MQAVRVVLEARAEAMLAAVEQNTNAMAFGDERSASGVPKRPPTIDCEWNTFKIYGQVGQAGDPGHRRLLIAHIQGAYHFVPSDKNIGALMGVGAEWFREEVDEQSRI